MSELFGRAPSDGSGRDRILADALEALDPASHDPSYWFRFRGWVMNGAAGELARRRLTADLTVGDVLASWARTVVPTALLAAAVAGMIMVRSEASATQQFVGVEELLVSEIPTETVPILLSTDAAAGMVAFAAEIF